MKPKKKKVRRREWTDENVVEFRRLAATGLTAKMLARRLRRTPYAIRARAIILRIKIGKQKPWTRAALIKINKLIDQNLPTKEIKKSFPRRTYNSVASKVNSIRAQRLLSE